MFGNSKQSEDKPGYVKIQKHQKTPSSVPSYMKPTKNVRMKEQKAKNRHEERRRMFQAPKIPLRDENMPRIKMETMSKRRAKADEMLKKIRDRKQSESSNDEEKEEVKK